MFTCFICNNNFNSHKSLILHLKTFHNSSINSIFLCNQNGCVRTFNNIYTFKRHLLYKHSESPIGDCKDPLPFQSSSTTVDHCEDDIDPEISSPTLSDKTNNTVYVQTHDFDHTVKNSAANFVSNLYNSNIVTKAHVQHIVSNTSEFLGSGFISCLKDEVLKSLTENNVDEKTKTSISDKFNILEDPFSELNTEYKRMQYFSKCGLLIKPESFIIGQSLESKLVDKERQILPVSKTGQIIPLREVFKCFFELPGVFDTILNYTDELRSNSTIILSNFMQGSLWRDMSASFEGKLTLPLFLYFDDFETNNPLGSHAGTHKLGAVYVSLPCIPTEFRSSLKNIFLAMLFYTKDRSEFGNRAVFQPLLNELQFLLETGITIQSTTTSTQVHFALSLVLGDNLGINSIQGFVESFSANFPCRICKAPKVMIQSLCVEDKTLCRTKESYQSDTSDISHENSGIKELSVWNDLSCFHSVLNSSCDVMHDLYEGVCRYDMSNIITYCLSKKYFTLDTLNDRTCYFDYGSIESNNKPPNVTLEKLKNKTLGFSAAEMLCFVRNFSLIIGDLIPSRDPIWDFYLTLSQIISLTAMVAIQSDCVNLLQTLIQEHNEMYIMLFKEALKPKHHFLIHYPSLILRIGPLVHVSSMRFEAKHKDFKQAAHVSSCRKNLPYSLALKHQLKLCYRLHTNEGLVMETITGQCDEVDIRNLLSGIDMITEPSPILLDFCMKLSWIKIGGITYKPSQAVVVTSESNYLPTFAKICCVLSNNERDICLLCKAYYTLCYDNHYNAFEVVLQEKWMLILVQNLGDKYPVYCRKLPNGQSYISVR